MKKVICVDNSGFNLISLNKIYEVISSTRDYYFIKNDANVEKRYGKARFQIVKEEIKTEEPAIDTPKTTKKANGVICVFAKGDVVKYNHRYYPKGETPDGSKYVIEINGKDEELLKSRFIPEAEK